MNILNNRAIFQYNLRFFYTKNSKYSKLMESYIHIYLIIYKSFSRYLYIIILRYLHIKNRTVFTDNAETYWL